MLEKVKKIIVKLFGFNKETNTPVSKYPYQYSEPQFGISFNINNPIEEFRLKNWGGEKEYVLNLLNSLKVDDIFFDIGASVGLISVLAADRLKKGKVISFEPDPENLLRLKNNYDLNLLTNYGIQSLAVGDEEGYMNLYTAGANAFSPSLQKVNGIDSFISVKVETIDNLLKANLVPYPTVIKIDIEGAEMMALKGMKNLLCDKNAPRIIFLEIHPEFLPKFGTNEEAIFIFLEEFDYQFEEKNIRDKQVLVKLVKREDS
ncbi:MAG: FkbM family methyltransferase [Bacteroidetes bacterium]|nr:FkbM family methyltransferase [Bacteroidota bacterium]